MEFELELIKWMQSFQNGFMDTLFQFFTMFGEELVIIAALGYLYWCHDKKIGEYVGVTVFISLFLNSTIKTIVQRPRPFVTDPDGILNIRPDTATGYAFPSGHTQGAATVFAGLATWIKKRWLTIASYVIIVVVALSRMYLGAHYLSDVIVGAALGIGLAIGLQVVFTKLKDHTRTFYNILTIVGVALTVIVFAWRYATIEAEGELTDAANLYDKMEGTFKMIGAMLGFVFGVRFEAKKVGFVNHRILWRNLIRFALGVAVVMGVRYGLKAIFGLI
ncbi:MAG: phosphatase PAP2 family protein, partial [Bacillota bacterium]|nr:phosphatase PAP2 family protein [Bacillota bacterium]